MNNHIRKKVSAITAAMLFSVAVCAQNTTAIDWQADLDYLAKTLPEKHCNLFVQKSEDYFFSGIERIKNDLSGLNDFETAAKVQQLIAGLGDSHTALAITPLINKTLILPLDMYWFSDGLYVLNTITENACLLGCRIVSVNGTDLSTVADSLKTLAAGNAASAKINIPKFLPSVQILEYFGFARHGIVELGYMTPEGELRTATVKPAAVKREEIISVQPDSTAFCDGNRNAFFTAKFFENGNIYYLQYNRCHSRELEERYGNRENAPKMPSFGEFEAGIFETLKSKPVDRIIFDLRFNGGGNSSQGTEFIGKLSDYLKDNPETALYVVLGRNTFSSAILNAMDCKNMTDAIFVGEATSGKPNHYGEVKAFRLPDSGLNVLYSTKYFKRSDEDPDTIMPDVVIERSFADYIKGIDPVFEWIKEQ